MGLVQPAAFSNMGFAGDVLRGARVEFMRKHHRIRALRYLFVAC